jgi:hypothetical protein
MSAPSSINSIQQELRRENEKILEQYKIKMELEFQHHIKDMMQGLQDEEDEEQEEYEPIDYDDASATNKEFFSAAQNRASSPTIKVYQGKKTKKASNIVRASTETLDTVEPAVVKTSGGLVKKQQAAITTQNRSKETPERLYMYADPVSTTVVMSPVQSKKRLTKEQFLKEQADKTRTLRSIEPNEDEMDPLEGRMKDTTRDALAKSRELLRETASLKGVKSKSKKKNTAATGPLPSMAHQHQHQQQPKGYRSVEVTVRPDSRSGEQRGMQDREGAFPPLTPKSRPGTGSGQRPSSSRGAERFGADDTYAEEFEDDVPMSPARYVTQPVEADEIDGYYNKHTWENHLARHILSVFATSHASTKPSQSKAVLEMVEGSQGLRPDDLKTKQGLFTGLRQQQKRVEEIAKRPKTSQKKKTKGGTQRQGSAKAFRAPLEDPVAGIAHDGVAKLVPSDRPVRNEVVVGATKNVPMVSTVRGPPKVFPIWFYSSGDPYAEWLALPDGHRLQNQLDSLREKKQFLPYLERVSAVLDTCVVEAFFAISQQKEAKEAASLSKSSKTGSKKKRFDDISGEEAESSLTLEELRPLCRQIVLVANAFATLAIENKQSDKSMGLIRVAENWAAREDILDTETRAELRSYIDVTLAFYFFKRKMTSASLSHSTKAFDYFTKMGRDDFVANCLLMLSCCKYQVSNFKAAHKVCINHVI